MKNSKVKYTHEPIKAEVTLALSRKSVDFFKSEAEKHHAQYQRMIRKLLDAYVDSRGALTSSSSRRSRLRRVRG